jgi:hypothetical protein
VQARSALIGDVEARANALALAIIKLRGATHDGDDGRDRDEDAEAQDGCRCVSELQEHDQSQQSIRLAQRRKSSLKNCAIATSRDFAWTS